MVRLLTVVPAYNEEASIEGVVKEIRSVFPESDILVVNDGSQDETVARAHRAGAKVLSLSSNVGIGGAVQAGYKWAALGRHTAVLRMDSDGQHIAAEAKALVDCVAAGRADVAIGSRFLEDNPSTFRSTRSRRIGIRLFSSLVSRFVAQRITDPTSGMRCVTRDVALYSADHHPHDYPEIESLIHYDRAGFRIVEVPVTMRERGEGKSSIAGMTSLYYTARVLLALLLLVVGRRHGREN